MYRIRLPFLILLLILLTSSVFAQDSLVVTLSARMLDMWDTPIEFKYENDRGYLLDQSFGLCRLDMSDLENPSEVGRSNIDLPMANYNSIHVIDNFIIVGAGNEGILVFDDTDLEADPQQIQFEALDYIGPMLIHNGYAYVSSGTNLHVLDFSDVLNPTLVNTLENFISGKKIVDGNYLYSLNTEGLSILDISDPELPIELSFSARPDLTGMFPNENDLVIDQGYAYVVGRMFGLEYAWLRIIDVSDPQNPETVNTIINNDELLEVAPTEIDLHNNNLILSGTYGVAIYEITEAGSVNDVATWTEILDASGGNTNAYINGDHYIHFGDYTGLQVINVSDVQAPQIVCQYMERGNLTKVKTDGFFAYALNQNFGNPELYVFNNIDPDEPVLLSTISFESGGIVDFDVQDNYLYINRDYSPPQLGSFDVYDMMVPQEPVYVGGYVSNFDCREILVQDDVAVVCHSIPGATIHPHYWVDIVDISNPQNPYYTDRHETGLNYTKPVQIKDGFLYMAVGGDINVYDIENSILADMYSFYRLPENAPALSIAAWEEYLFVLSSENRGELIRLSIDNGMIEYVDSWNLDVELKDVYIHAGNLFQVTDTGLEIYSIENPLEPVHLTTADISENIKSIAIGEDILVAAERYFYTVYDLEGYTNVGQTSFDLPQNFALHPAYPNPFNPSVKIPFTLNQAGKIKLSIYDILGREVSSIVNGHLSSGYHQYLWDAANDNLSSGTYFIKLESSQNSQVKRIQMIK